MPVYHAMPAAAPAIERFKERFAVCLPAAYEGFLRHHNGLFVSDGDYVDLSLPTVAGGLISFQALFGLDARNVHFDLAHVNADLRGEIGVATQGSGLVIGDDPGGNYYVLNTIGGAVCYWDRTHLHEGTPDYAEAAEEGDLYVVADSFASFLAGLHAKAQAMRFVGLHAWPES